MQKCFIADTNSQFVERIQKYINDKEKQRLYVADFLKKYGIESIKFIVNGNGHVGCPFPEDEIKEIRFGIEATDGDWENLRDS